VVELLSGVAPFPARLESAAAAAEPVTEPDSDSAAVEKSVPCFPFG